MIDDDDRKFEAETIEACLRDLEDTDDFTITEQVWLIAQVRMWKRRAELTRDLYDAGGAEVDCYREALERIADNNLKYESGNPADGDLLIKEFQACAAQALKEGATLAAKVVESAL